MKNRMAGLPAIRYFIGMQRDQGQMTFIEHEPPDPMTAPLATIWSPISEWQAVAWPQSLQPGLPSYETTWNVTPGV